jgi:hypothetical protein
MRTKEELIEATMVTMRNNIKKDCENHPMIGTPMEGMAVMSSLQNTAETCKESLQAMTDLIDEYKFSKEDVEEIVNTAYRNIHDQLFE